MRLQSNKVTVNKPVEGIFNFLSDFRNFEKLMPEQVTNWKSTGDECSFTIAGMANLEMKMKEKIPNSVVTIEGSGKPTLDFTLTCNIEDNQQQCNVQLFFDADLNPMMQMMASKPLTNFLNLLALKLKNSY